MTDTEKQNLLNVAPYFIVENVSETVEFYTKKLGFKIDWIGEGLLFAIISRGEVSLMLRQLKKKGFTRPNRLAHVEAGWHTDGAFAWDAYIWVENADELFLEFKENSVNIIRPLENSEYGNRDFEIEDNNGYILCFGHSL
ncbi:VOC family protein [Splendidivirga corallicola]